MNTDKIAEIIHSHSFDHEDRGVYGMIWTNDLIDALAAHFTASIFPNNGGIYQFFQVEFDLKNSVLNVEVY